VQIEEPAKSMIVVASVELATIKPTDHQACVTEVIPGGTRRSDSAA